MNKKEIAVRALFFASLVVLTGCVTRDDPMAANSLVREVDLIGSQKLIICAYDPAICTEQAERACPKGYDVLRSDINDPEVWRKTIVISCR